jgi:hypothetical protein
MQLCWANLFHHHANRIPKEFFQMITVWTIMVITFSDTSPFGPVETFMPFSNPYLCGENIDPMREQLEADGLEIKMIRCIRTTIESGEIE